MRWNSFIILTDILNILTKFININFVLYFQWLSWALKAIEGIQNLMLQLLDNFYYQSVHEAPSWTLKQMNGDLYIVI